MNTKAFLKLLQVLLPVALIITSCGPDSAAADTTGADVTSGTAAVDYVQSDDVQPGDTQKGLSPKEDTVETSDLAAEASSSRTASAETPMSGNAAASVPSDDAFDPYAIEVYDAVPDYLSERHDNVDYGTIEANVEYYSETAGDVKYCNVLLPAGYDPSQEYPVLYMYHGFGGRYDSHVHEDSILQTLYGNMLHEGLTVPMIIVGADMYTDLLAEKDEKSDAELRPCYDKGVDDLALDLMPFIESRYSVKKGRLYTAVTGVSQGATNSLAAGFKWQSKIGYIGSFAPCPGVIPTPYYTGTFWNTPILDDLTVESPETMPVYIYLTVGTEDPWCIDSTLYYGKLMDDKGIPNHTVLVDGYDHDNDLWELGHYNFLLRIFRN